jgi:uncharacterized protein (DUF1501 family)
MSTRKAFLKSGAIAAFGISIGGVPGFVARAAQQFQHKELFQKNKILICIFQRGAMDGLMAVTPFNDPYLKKARPSLFMSAAKSEKVSLIDLDGQFGLHPSMSIFEPLFKNNQLAIVHGIGSPNNTRSHFDAQDYMESGTPFKKSTDSGWLNRAAGLMEHQATPFRAVSLTPALPRSFYGNTSSIAINNLADFKISSNQAKSNLNVTAKSFEDLYDETTSQIIKNTGKETFEAVELLSKLNLKKYQPNAGVIYPNSNLGNALKQIAQLIKSDVGLEIGFAESSGWDTHFNQGTANGIFARNVSDLSNSIAALWNDLGDDLKDNVVIMTMTEFGRTVKQNGTNGTDHGRASCNFILGTNIKGGKVYGDIKPLSIENLEDGRDLPVTTDFRSVFNEVAQKHLNIKNSKQLFPEWNGGNLDLF